MRTSWHAAVRRFTPTRVGTTSYELELRRAKAVHPHARGDNLLWKQAKKLDTGSPPRAWGQRSASRAQQPGRRFTPTRVGTTYLPWCPSLRRAVHPHARGDNFEGTPHYTLCNGSPPRAWGQRSRKGGRIPTHRFTPTRVGTTWAMAMWCSFPSVHPHARGDNNRRDLHLIP